jgi:hypothetical protein
MRDVPHSRVYEPPRPRSAERALCGPVTRTGQNEVIVIELEQMLVAGARFAPGPLLGPAEE